jgi:YD repeat-containing protein
MRMAKWRPWVVVVLAWLLCGHAWAGEMRWAVCMRGGTFPPDAGCTRWVPTAVQACDVYKDIFAANVVFVPGYSLGQVNFVQPSGNGSGCSVDYTVIKSSTGQVIPAWLGDSGWLLSRFITRVDLFHDKPLACSPKFGNPIYPLTGSRAQAEVLGSWLAGGQALTARYDTRRMIPVEGPADPWNATALPSFAGLWHSSWHRSLVIQSDPQGAALAVQASRGGGVWVSFQRNDADQYRPDADVNDRLERLSAGWRYLDAAARSEETYDNQGRLSAIDFAAGERLEFSYDSAVATGLLAKVQDSRGRSVQFQYEDAGNGSMRINRIVDPAGTAIAVAYTAGGQLGTLVWPDGTQRQFLYEAPAQAWALTGLVDENARRMSTYSYDADGLAIGTELAGGVDRYTVSYDVAPRWRVTQTFDTAQNVLRVDHEWQAPQGVSVTLPPGSSTQLGTSAVRGMPRLTSRSQAAGSGCEASTSASVLDANGNAASRDDFNGGRTCYAYDLTRNLQTTSVEGLGAGASCAAVVDSGVALPAGTRKTSMQWHPDWPLVAARSGPRELQINVYNGQRNPVTGSLADCADGAQLPDGKPIAVLCQRTELATTDADGSQALAAAVFTPPTSSDPGDASYASVSSLLHLDGGNGTTAITDNGPAHHTWTSTGNAALSTAQSRFGGASFNPGSGVAVSPVTADYLFGSGDFTVEAWVFRTATPASAGAIVTLWATGKCSWYLGVDASNRLVFFSSTTGSGGFSFPAFGFVPSNAWVHVAAVRQGANLRFFINGALAGQTAIDWALYAPVGSNATLGAAGDVIQQWPGYIDEVRITKGVARYTGAFAVPTTRFPAFATPVQGGGSGGGLTGVDASVPARTWTYTYNSAGQVLTAKNTRGGVTTTTSSTYFADTNADHTKGDLATTTDAAGKVITYDKYTRAGQLLQSTDSDGVVTVNTYDLRQRLLTTTVGGETTTYTYDPVGQLTQVTEQDGSWIAYEYDDARRQKAVMDSSGNRIEYALDNAGNSTGQTVKDPTGSLKRNMARVMDALGRAQENSGRE